jgi:RND family efflux transporter MFP subunit
MRLPVALGMVCLAGCSGPYSEKNVAAKESAPPIRVQVERVLTTNIPEIITANGELFAEEVATITAKVPGRITHIMVDLGTTVAAGQPVAELDKEDYLIRVRQMAAAVEQTRARLGINHQTSDEVDPARTAMVQQADAALKEARFIFDTTTKLQQDGVVSKIDLEKAGVRRQAAEAHRQVVLEEVMQLRAQLVERRATLELARQQLADLTIRAPFAGAITKRIAAIGEYLPANAQVATIVRQNPLRVRVEIPERLAVKVKAGQRIDISMDAGTTRRTGRVVRLSPAIEAQNRSLLVEGEIPNADGALRPGAFVEATVTVNPNAEGITAPAAALISFAGTERMFVVDGRGQLDERMVRTARRLAGEKVEVISGLKDGELLVRNATDRMIKGMKVTVTERAEAR